MNRHADRENIVSMRAPKNVEKKKVKYQNEGGNESRVEEIKMLSTQPLHHLQIRQS